MRPTIITGLKDNSRCMQEEIFGPVTCVTPFDTEEEVICRVNDTPYGLCASVFTSNLARGHRVAHNLKVIKAHSSENLPIFLIYEIMNCYNLLESATSFQVCSLQQVGTVWTNCWLVRDLDMPFGGVKTSGMGRESTQDSLEFYTEAKTICTKI